MKEENLKEENLKEEILKEENFNDLENQLSDDGDGKARDKYLGILKRYEQEVQAALDSGLPEEEYKRYFVLLNGIQSAQIVLIDYHQILNLDK